MGRQEFVDVEVILDPKCVENMAVDKELGEDLRRRAEKGKTLFQSQAPFKRGHYKKRVKVRRRIERVWGMRRQVAWVQGTDPKDWAVEWGKGAHHTMGHVAEELRDIR